MAQGYEGFVAQRPQAAATSGSMVRKKAYPWVVEGLGDGGTRGTSCAGSSRALGLGRGQDKARRAGCVGSRRGAGALVCVSVLVGASPPNSGGHLVLVGGAAGGAVLLHLLGVLKGRLGRLWRGGFGGENVALEDAPSRPLGEHAWRGWGGAPAACLDVCVWLRKLVLNTRLRPLMQQARALTWEYVMENRRWIPERASRKASRLPALPAACASLKAWSMAVLTLLRFWSWFFFGGGGGVGIRGRAGGGARGVGRPQ